MRRTTVSDCRALGISDINDEGFLDSGYALGTFRWSRGGTDRDEDTADEVVLESAW